MLAAGFDGWLLWAREIAAIGATGAAIRLMDDLLDIDHDVDARRFTTARRLGVGAMPYGLAALAAAAMLDVAAACSLFFAAYAVGMAGDVRRRLPSGLAGWHEGLLGLAICGALIGASQTIWAVCALGWIQLVDDLEDFQADRVTGAANLAHRFGAGEVRIAAVATLFAAASLRPAATVIVIAWVWVIEVTSHRLARRQRTMESAGGADR